MSAIVTKETRASVEDCEVIPIVLGSSLVSMAMVDSIEGCVAVPNTTPSPSQDIT